MRRASRRFVPVLSWVVCPKGRDPGAGGPEGQRRAEAELDVVLAVLAAVTGPEAVRPDGCWGYDMKTKRCRCQLHRALEDLHALAQRAPRPRRRRRTIR